MCCEVTTMNVKKWRERERNVNGKIIYYDHKSKRFFYDVSTYFLHQQQSYAPIFTLANLNKFKKNSEKNRKNLFTLRFFA
jgi:hypothetical protein